MDRTGHLVSASGNELPSPPLRARYRFRPRRKPRSLGSPLPDRENFEAMLWVMECCKLVVEGAAAASVAALMHWLVTMPASSCVAAVRSGGNLNLGSAARAALERTRHDSYGQR